MIKDQPKITVLIPTFNRAKFLGECIESILAQTLPASQILVVNDGSSEDTLKVLARFGSSVETIETVNLGKSGALNQGLTKVRGDYLWIFDDDDVVLPDALERFTRPLENDPDYGFSYSSYYFTDTIPETGRIGPILFEQDIPDLESRGFLIPLLENNFLGGAALFARTSCYKAVGNFDESLVRSQDYEMAIRIARRFKGARAPGGATFHYRQHEGARGSTKDRFEAELRLKKWLFYDQTFFRKLYQELELQEYLPPGSGADQGSRQAFFQRLMIMANKQLILESIRDLEVLAGFADQSALSKAEQAIIRDMIHSKCYQAGSLLDQNEFSRAIMKLSASSGVIRSLRSELSKAILKNVWGNFGPRRAVKKILRIVRLYI